MSRILVDGRLGQTPCPVVIGWDRPLQSCFIQYQIPEELEEDERFAPVVTEMDATALAILSEEDVRASLARAGVAVPAEALAELSAHMRANKGNTIVRFSATGERKVVLE